MILKKDFEYIISYNVDSTLKTDRLIVKSISNDIITFHENNLMLNEKDIISFIEPVSAVEMFQMWMNYNSIKGKISESSLKELHISITQTLKNRSYVISGKGKLEPYDYEKMNFFLQ